MEKKLRQTLLYILFRGNFSIYLVNIIRKILSIFPARKRRGRESEDSST